MFEAKFFRRDFWLRGSGRYLVASLLVVGVALLGVVPVFVPSGGGQQDGVVDRDFWLRLATNAWNYFQPGYGVDSGSGLHKAGLYWPYFTDWDLGLYIQAVIDADRLGIISRGGSWGADARFERVLGFLEARELTERGVPYLWYESATGRRSGDVESNACDSGKLLVALQNLRSYRPEYVARVNFVVYNRTNYEPLKQAVDVLWNSVNIYDYYVACGFAAFWPERFSSVADSVLDRMTLAPGVTDAYGTVLPLVKLTGETLLHSVFELPPNAKLTGLAQRFYVAHEARYSRTGRFVAFSEGNTDLDSPSYVYEWVVVPSGQTWVIKGPLPEEATFSIPPIVYFKVAVGLLALSNTNFTRSMVSYVESKLPYPSTGYVDGVDDNGRVVTTTIDKTNGLILGAAAYAVRNLFYASPSPSSFVPALSPTPTPASTVYPTFAPSPSPSATSAFASPESMLTPTPTDTPDLPSSPTLPGALVPDSTVVPSPSLSPSSSVPLGSVSPSPAGSSPLASMNSTEVAAPSFSATPEVSSSLSPSVSADFDSVSVEGSVLDKSAVLMVGVFFFCLFFVSLFLIRRGKF